MGGHVPARRGDSFYVIDTRVTYRAVAAESWVGWMAFEAWVPPGGGPSSLHAHEAIELFVTLDGAMTYLVQEDGGRLRRTEGFAGCSAFAPSWAPHTFRNLSYEPARYLAVVSPGAAMEGFFASVRQEVGPTGRPCGLPDWDHIAAMRAAAGITWLAPPRVL
jgi:mannose-6-phosphate isomerase-like protein (cupin superfamily)